MTTLPHTMIEPQDDPAFLALVDRIIATLVRLSRPMEVHLIHVDNWFDHKWLRFSGYGIVPFPGGSLRYHSAKKEQYQDKLTFPPFTPNRVVAQYLFCRMADGNYEEQAPTRLIHPAIRQRSSLNLHRRVSDFSKSSLFFWYSSGSAANGRASMLAYSVSEEAVAARYAGFSRRDAWHLSRVKGINRQQVMSLLISD